MTRLEWFKNEVDYSQMLSHQSYRDCDRMVVNRHGDIIEYQVEGDERKGFELYVR